MVPAADVVGGLDKRFVFIAAQTVQHVRAHNGVRFHKIELLRGKPPGLVQNLIVYRNLSDVVQRRRHDDQLLRFGRQVIPVGFLRQPLQKALVSVPMCSTCWPLSPLRNSTTSLRIEIIILVFFSFSLIWLVTSEASRRCLA